MRHLPRNHVDLPDAAARHRQVASVTVGDLAGLLAVLVDAEVVHLGARHDVAQCRVRVQADEEVRAVVVGNGGPSVEGDDGVAAASEDNADTQQAFQQRAQPQCDAQRDVLLHGPFRSVRAFIRAAVARVDDDGANLRGEAEVGNRDRVARGGVRTRVRRFRRPRFRDRGYGRFQVDHQLRRVAGFSTQDAMRCVRRSGFDREARKLFKQLDGADCIAARHRGAHDVDSVGVEANEEAAVVLDHLVQGVGSNLQGQPTGLRARAVLSRYAGNAHLTDEQ